MNPIRPISALALAALLALLLSACRIRIASAQQTRADAEKDPVLAAMLTELDRSMSQLQLQGFAKPFFIQYRIEEVDDFETKAEFGSSEGSEHAHQRVARVTVRVGDYKTDSSGGRGDGSIELVALDNDPIALRTALWTATDQAYKNALSAYAQKQAALKQVQTPPQADDFSHEKPIVSLAEPVTLHFDEDEWAQRVARMSGLYRTDATVSATQRDVEDSTRQFSRPFHHHMARHQRGNHRPQIRGRVPGGICRRRASHRRHAPRTLVRFGWPFPRRSGLRGGRQQARSGRNRLARRSAQSPAR